MAPVAADALAVNAPNKVPNKDRPIACAIKRVRIVPDAPTKVPAIINMVFSRT